MAELYLAFSSGSAYNGSGDGGKRVDFQEFQKHFSIHLNNQQLQAVQAVEGPLLLLAVPGSGKTTVLVTRIAYLLYCCQVLPEDILTLTYTRAAARDMAERFYTLFGNEFAGRVMFRTINSICDGIIRYYGKKIGKAPFTLESDEKRLRQILISIYQKAEKTYPSDSDLKMLQTLITYIKNMRLSKEQIKELGYTNALDNLPAMVEEYQAQMRRNRKMDYDDQMVYAYNILQKSPETLRAFQQRFRFLCIDEAQDTSKIQHEIIALLAAGTENLFMVGDEDQSIYGFRAAYPKALLEFENTHKGARILLMEQNFRSSGTIVEAADRLIRNNKRRHEKIMVGSRPLGTPIRNVEMKYRKGQYRYLLKVAQNLSQAGQLPDYRAASAAAAGVPLETTAVLFRYNESALPLIDLLEQNRVPYRMQGRDLTFFTSRTVTDLRQIIRFAQNPKDTDAFLQIYYKIGLYISKAEAQEAARFSRESGKSVLRVLEEDGDLDRYRLSRIRAARTNFSSLLTEPAGKALVRVMKGMGYEEYLEQTGLPKDRMDILKMLTTPQMTLSDLFLKLDWLRDRIACSQDDPSCPFFLSTIHSSKGLEYHHVFLIDCADGLFPRSLSSPSRAEKGERLPGISEDLEEERRMFYVAVTRARDTLTVFSLPEGSLFLTELLEKPAKRGTR